MEAVEPSADVDEHLDELAAEPQESPRSDSEAIATTDHVVRKVTLRDKAAIIDASHGIYAIGSDGASDDYLPLVLDSWLVDTDRHCYGIEADGKIVGFCCNTILDAGKTVWQESLRIDSDYRGQGLMKELTRKSDALFSQVPAYSGLKRARWSSYQSAEEKEREKDRTTLLGTYHIASMNIKREITRQQLKSLVDFAEFGLGSDMDGLKELRVPEFLELLNYKKVQNVYLNWCGFETSKENLRVLSVGSNSFGKCTFHTLESEEADDDPEERSYSISTIAPKLAGKTMVITIDAENDGPFVSHLNYHVQKALDSDCKRIQVHYPHYEGEESDRVGLLSAIFSETLTYDFPISLREADLSRLVK